MKINRLNNKISWQDCYSENFNWNDYKFYITTKLSRQFINEFQHKINWDYLLENQQLTCKLLEKYKNYLDNVCWRKLSAHQKLTTQFIKNHQNKVDWLCVSTYQKLSCKFIDEFQTKVDWNAISKCQQLNEDFIKKFKNKLNWKFIFNSQLHLNYDKLIKIFNTTKGKNQYGKIDE